MTDINGFKYNAYAILNKHSNATSTYKFLQIKKYASNVAYYVQVPQMPGNITTISMTVSSSQKPMTDGGNTYTLYFSNSSKTSTTGNGVASGTGDKSVTIDCSTLNLKEGYITANGSVRIWDITVTYESATPPTPAKTYDVTWMVNGEEWDKTEGVEENTQITNLPTEPTDNCGNKVFQGWTDKPISGTTNTKPSILFKDKSPEITEELTTFYAVFATETNSGSGNLTTTFTPNVDDLSTGKNGITIKMSNTVGASGYYQIYKSSSMTIESEDVMTSFTLTCTAENQSKYGPGNITFTEGTYSYSNYTGTWTGNATSLTSSKAAEQLRIKNIVVTTSSVSTTISDYTTSCSQQPIQLAKPTGLEAKEITSNSAILSWDEVENKSSYKVTITDDHDYTETFTVMDEKKSVTNLSPNTTYYWTVQAIGDGTNYTDSETSEQSSFNTLVPCTDAVTISKGTPNNGSFKLDKTGEQSTCNGAVTVTLSDIQPADGYQFSTITQSGVDDAKVTIDNVAKTVTYAQNTTGESTINVTFTPIEYTLELESTLSCVTNGSATIAYNATSAKTFTAATRDDYTCTGYWNAPSGGVQVLKADGTFVGDVSGFISGGKWVNTTATKLTPRWETEYKMILSKGTEENGTYTLSPTNIETSSCATSTTRQVTITATPVVGYEVDQITYSGEGTATIKTGPTISAGKTTWVYTFDENDKGLGTFIVTFKQLPTYTVTWMANEQQHAAQTAAVGTSLTNPGDPEASTYACDDKVFVGWTAEKNYSNTTTAPDDLFKSAEATSKTIPENGITYCAVFANATTIPGVTTTTEETATLSFADEAQRESISSTQQVWKQNGIVFTNNQAGSSTPVADYVDPVRCYKGSNIVIDCNDLGDITKVQFKCDESKHADNLATSIGSEASTTTNWVTLIPKTETKVYEISLSSGQTRISSLIVTYEKSIVNDPIVTYSNYSTTCEAIPDVELQSIEISGDLTKKNYTAGDDLDFGGLTVTAKYSNAPSKNVTNEVEWSDVTLTVGQTSVTLTATYEGKTDDITITGLTVSSPATPEPESEWVLTTLADITCSDLVVITMKNSNGTYALTNGNGTSDAPKATEVEIANDKLKTEPSEILQWVVMNNNGDLTIYPVNDYNRWLYCINNNNGVRVGDNEDNKLFTIDADYGYMYNVGRERYLGVYNSQDWRCYTTMHDNIKGQTLCFYVKKDANPNPCEKPVDDGINPVATFIFNTAEGLDDLGIDYPNTPAESGAYKNDMSNDESYTQEGITFTNVQNGSTATRVWCSSAGNLDLRIYQNATVKFSVPDNMYIRKIIFNGDALSSISPDKGNLKSKIWTGREREILFSVADGANVVKIYTISFALEYTRTVTPDNQWGTICLPYASASTTGATFYEVSSLVVGEGLWLDQLANGAQLVAGKPYIFYATDSEITVTYTGDAKAAPVAGENGLRGTFTDIAEGGVQGHYIIAKNQIWVANDKNTLPAYRAYINAGVVPTTAQAQLPGRRRVCMGENTTTDFENITNGENNTIKVIENGQLIIIRNGEKYNVQGQKL